MNINDVVVTAGGRGRPRSQGVQSHVVNSALQTVPASGASLVVETQGQGYPAVALVHGFADDRTTWNRVCIALSQRRQVVRYDLRGYGESAEFGDAPFRHGHDLLLILDRLKIDRCDLLGASMGGSIALNFALDHPGRVRRLVLISPGLVGWEWSAEWRTLWDRITDAARGGRMAEARELWWIHPLFATARAHAEAREQLRESISRYSGKQWIADNEEPALPDLDRLTSLAVPTLLLTGARDLADFRLIADLIEGAAPNVSRVDFEGSGHLLHLERPEEVIARVEKFLA